MSELEKKNLLIDPSGNVGIGTDNPKSILDISCNGNNNEDGIIIKNTWKNNNQTTFLKLGIGDNNWVSMRANTDVNDETYLTFNTQLGTNNWEDTMTLRNKHVGIGSSNPSYPLYVSSSINYITGTLAGASSGAIYHLGNWNDTGSTWGSGSSGNQFNNNFTGHGFKDKNFSCYFSGFIMATFGMLVQSDKRIKTDIIPINDSRALDIINKLECYEYNYIDPMRKLPIKTIGFMAQEVKKLIPGAVDIINDFIPDEMRIINNVNWEHKLDKWKLTINDLDLSNNHTGKCRFYVSDISNHYQIVRDINVENDKKSFIFDKKWANIMFWGKEVNDFHSLDKNKIFSIHHSAIQELSRQNDAKTLEINNLKEKVNTLEDKLNKVMHHLGMN